ncbi:MAG TPA: DoxX family protein [Solirubrobacterales bacterium]|nr:DoxX family protein [Solirubrobacterales bacterium]
MSDLRGTASIAAGLVFLGFGIAKFVNHANEVDSFRTYGLPAPDAFVYAIGTIEVAGGLLLIAGLAARTAALALAVDMVGAIAVSGIKEGEPISLTLAPVLLVIMIAVLWAGPGRWPLSRRSSPPARARPGSAR